MPLFGSNPSTAMDLAIGLLNDANAKRGKILLMTDGISGLDEELLITEQFADNDYQLLIMGIGTEEGAPIPTNDGNFLTDNNGVLIVPTLNKDILQSLANRSNGRYHDIQLADSDLAYLLSDFEILDDEQLSSVEEEFDIWHESGPWLLLLILPIAALSFRRGWLFSFTLIVSSGLLFQSQQAQALEWKDLWKTKNQQAAEAYTSEEHAAAAALFESKDWQGAANYRAENYEAAVAAFNTIDSADGHYNRGNALALLGNYQEAIAAYDVTLELDGSHADALKNKNIVEELLKQEESESGENQDSEGQEGQSEQDSESGEEQESESGEEQDQEDSQDSQQEQQQQNQTQEEQEDSESNSEQDTPKETTNEEFEEQQSLEQWLRRIEDDPGELLRRKFRYQYRQRQLNGTTNNLQSGEQIW
jgi:Ca-activated chloride channel family protein